MAQRVYLIVVDDEGDIGVNYELLEAQFQNILKQWDHIGSSAMDHVELTVSAEDADPDDYPEGSPRDDGDIMSDLGDHVDDLQCQIDQKQREKKR